MEKKQKSERGKIIFMIVGLILLGIWLYRCTRDDGKDFPPEYYQSIEFEKQLRDGGMTEWADREKADRKYKLKNGTYKLEEK